MASKVFFMFLTVSLLLLGPLGAPYMGGGSTAEADDPKFTIVCTDLKFGRVVALPMGTGSVVIDPSLPSPSGRTLQGLIAFSGDFARTQCDITGHGKFTITVVPTPTFPIKSGVFSVDVTDITVFPSNTGNFGPDGLEIIFIGGTAEIGLNQQSGTYSETLTIFVDKP